MFNKYLLYSCMTAGYSKIWFKLYYRYALSLLTLYVNCSPEISDLQIFQLIWLHVLLKLYAPFLYKIWTLRFLKWSSNHMNLDFSNLVELQLGTTILFTNSRTGTCRQDRGSACTVQLSHPVDERWSEMIPIFKNIKLKNFHFFHVKQIRTILLHSHRIFHVHLVSRAEKKEKSSHTQTKVRKTDTVTFLDLKVVMTHLVGTFLPVGR